jgi:hypothetical protein
VDKQLALDILSLPEGSGIANGIKLKAADYLLGYFPQTKGESNE